MTLNGVGAENLFWQDFIYYSFTVESCPDRVSSVKGNPENMMKAGRKDQDGFSFSTLTAVDWTHLVEGCSQQGNQGVWQQH